jgi:O-antigen/teichoic acid export membrane protein
MLSGASLPRPWPTLHELKRVASGTQDRSFGANALVTLIAWTVPAIAALIAVRVTVRGLGIDQYGLLALTGSLTGYLGLMEMGLGTAIMRYLSYHRALNEGRPMIGVIKFGLRWFCGVGVAGGVFLWFAAPWLSSSVLHVSHDLLPTAITVMRLTGINFFLGLVTSVGTAVPQSFLRYDISSIINGVWGTVASAGPAVIVTLGYGLVAVVWFNVIVQALVLVVYAAVSFRLFRSVDLTAGPPWPDIRRKTLSFAGMTALNQIGYTVAQQTNRLVVGIAGGVAEAGYYQVPYLLASRVNSMLTTVAQVMFPTASGLMAKDDHEGVRTLYMRTSRLFFLVNFSSAVGLVVLAYPLLEFWVRKDLASQGALALALFAIAQSIHAATMSASFINLSAARPGINLVFSTMSSVINLAAIYPLTVHWGISGAAAAGLLAAANVPLFLHWVHRRVLDLSSWEVWRTCYQPTVLGAGLTGAAAYFFLRPLCHSLIVTLLMWCFYVLLSLCVSGLFGAVHKEDIRTTWRLVASAWLRLGWQNQR